MCRHFQGFVPPYATLFGLILAIVGVGFLIFFIHHIAHILQASTIIEEITATTLKAVDHYYPQTLRSPRQY